MRHSIRMLLLGGMVLAVAGCNTISGAGLDLSSVGKVVTRTADDVKN